MFIFIPKKLILKIFLEKPLKICYDILNISLKRKEQNSMKFKRIAALTMTSALLASLSTGTLAKDTDSQTMNLRLTVTEPDTSYLLTIPADMNDLQSGWNALGSGINVKNENKTFSEKKKVKITASSANDWNLKLDDSNKISYQLKSSDDLR